MHETMFARVLRAPMSYFTLTPLGKVLSVFSKDMDTVDESLLDNVHMVLIYCLILLTTLGVVIRVLPIFAAVAAFLMLTFLYFFRYYLAGSRALKDASGRKNASVVTHTSETLQGLAVIQAFDAEGRYRADNLTFLDGAGTAGYNLEMLQLWLSVRLDLIGCLLVLGTCILAVALERSLTAAAAGLAISNSFQILLFFSLMVRGAADIHFNIASVERVVLLSQVDPEPDLPLTNESCPKDGWPARGEVDFHGVVMSYLPNAPHVLKGVDFSIRRGEKIGVVGRTGAGKSSLIMCLFRLAELAEGGIRVDGVQINALALQELRRRIAIIPQEPTMFQGTLKSNLDPFGERSDEELRRALEYCLLGDLLRSSPLGLDTPVAYMGDNFSLGQQQLICLARAMLNPSRLLLLDEATAALDTDTDAAVQRVLRTHFSERTIITIAHRLDTIIDSDRILVMDAGRVAEFDTPHALLTRPNSIFARLCEQTGAQFDALCAAAARHHAAMTALTDEVARADEVRLALGVGEVAAHDNEDVDEEEDEEDDDEDEVNGGAAEEGGDVQDEVEAPADPGARAAPDHVAITL
jgi:ABC-type multidrug transport system fused ATPase/permease subunit